MLPATVQCEDCGQKAIVRGYGRIEYDWPKTINSGNESTTPDISLVRLTIDCPNCGVKSQEFFPNPARPHRQSTIRRPARITTTTRFPR